MSVKQMTNEQLQADLGVILNMGGGSPPPEQQDRYNALRAELKRRGADATPRMPEQASSNVEAMSASQLEAELRKLSQRIGANPNDEAAQERFADVRFEMRKRAGYKAQAPVPPPDPATQNRFADLGQEIAKSTPTAFEAPPAFPTKAGLSAADVQAMMANDVQPVAIAPTQDAIATVPSSVKGFFMNAVPGRGVLVTHTLQVDGILQTTTSVLTLAEADDFVAMAMTALGKARGL